MDAQELKIYRNYRTALGLTARAPEAPGSSGIPVKTSIPELSQRFRAFLFDGFGTLYNLNDIHPGAPGMLNHLRATGCAIRLITNAASRHPDKLCAHLRNIGIHFEPEEIICSGSLLSSANLDLKIQSALHLGRDEALCFLETAGITGTLFPDEPTVIISSAFSKDDPLLHPAEELLRMPGAKLVVLNPDAWAPKMDGSRMPVSGSLAWTLHQKTSCQTVFLGKPFPQIFQTALRSLPAEIGPAIMIGDTLGTDILGGQVAGLATALMLGGNSSWESLQEDEMSLGISPDYYLDGLR
jgi:HAD superfamily hydrolase (TIGR01450 family)